MKKIDSYIVEKLKINKEIIDSEKDSQDDYPGIGEKVLMIHVTRNSTRDDYVKYDVFEISDIDDENVYISNIENGKPISTEYVLIDYKQIKLKSYFTNYFAERKKDRGSFLVSFQRLFSVENGEKAIRYAIQQLNRGLPYVYGGFKLDLNGNSQQKIKYLKNVLDELKK